VCFTNESTALFLNTGDFSTPNKLPQTALVHPEFASNINIAHCDPGEISASGVPHTGTIFTYVRTLDLLRFTDTTVGAIF
jgi:hypothetical protein